MKDFGTKFSTTEGWGAVLLTILTIVKQFGWLPADVDPSSLVITIAQVVLGVITLIGLIKSAFRKGSVPFVADVPKQ